jgi:hypothetical protein
VTTVAAVEDAIELLTDSAMKAMGNPAAAELVEMRSQEILNELRARGAEDDVTARILVTEALDRLDGISRAEYVPSQLGGGRRAREHRIDRLRN